MARMKDYAMEEVYRLHAKGYTVKKIAEITGLEIDFILATLGLESE